MPVAKELRDMDNDMLIETLRNVRQELFNLRFQLATGELENTARLGGAKRDLARCFTVAKERGLDVEQELREI